MGFFNFDYGSCSMFSFLLYVAFVFDVDFLFLPLMSNHLIVLYLYLLWVSQVLIWFFVL